MEKLIEAVEAFNSLYPIWTELIVIDDFWVEIKRTLLSPAWIVWEKAIAKFSWLSGWYDISRVKMLMKYKSSWLGFSYLVPCDANSVAV